MPARTANVPFALRWCVLYLMQFPTGLHAALSTFSLHVRIDTNLSLSLSVRSILQTINMCIAMGYLALEFLSLIFVSLLDLYFQVRILLVTKVQVECLKENCSQFFENCGR